MIKIKDWSKFQHFKNRRPPWIKLYRELMDQLDINLISDCHFRILIYLWLLASEDPDMGGALPSIPIIAFKLRKSEQEIVDALQCLTSFVDHDDITMISGCHQHDDKLILQRQSRDREETEREGKKNDKPNRKTKSYERVPVPNNWEPNGEHNRRAQETHIDIGREAERFRNYHLAKGTESANWNASFTTWLINAVEFQKKDQKTNQRMVL